MKRLLMMTVLAVVVGTPVSAADEQLRNDLGSFYALWGMVEAGGYACMPISGGQTDYREQAEAWKSRHEAMRTEFNLAVIAAGETGEFIAYVQGLAITAVTNAINDSADPVASCTNWLAEMRSGANEGETRIAQQLGRLRERDGL